MTMPNLKQEHVLAIGLLAGAGVLFYLGHNMAGGSRPPRMAYTEALYDQPEPYVPIQADPLAGYLVTQHRFPHRVGHEISTMIEGGHSAASVPKWLNERDWFIRPPGELVL